jgi:glycerate 2-kinase
MSTSRQRERERKVIEKRNAQNGSGPLVVAAFDKFRLTATAPDLCRAVGDAAWERAWSCEPLPMADGGEGTLEVLATLGGSLQKNIVSGPLGDPVEATWLLRGKTAFIEMAKASGLAVIGGPQNNRPLDASTTGTGELMVAAIGAGAKRIVVTVGGSATTDGGFGALRAIEPLPRFRGIDLVVACDVETTFVNAAPDFGPQKGATPAQVNLLRRRLERLAGIYFDERGIDVREVPGSGAAGGLAGGLVSIGARIESGFTLVADEVNLAEAMTKASLVITGEGCLDEESFNGKVVGGVCSLAREANVKVVIMCGIVEEGFVVPTEFSSTVHSIISLSDVYGKDRAWNEAVALVREQTESLLLTF